jgi:Protein of unknown function (DUF1222).
LDPTAADHFRLVRGQTSGVVQKILGRVCLFVEIIVPFFIWAPRRVRLTAAGLLIFLQIAIAITGNYCFFNLLTIALCLLLIDDASVAAIVRRGSRGKYEPAATRERGYNFAAIVVLVITMPLNAWHIYSAFQPQADLKQPIRSFMSICNLFTSQMVTDFSVS